MKFLLGVLVLFVMFVAVGGPTLEPKTATAQVPPGKPMSKLSSRLLKLSDVVATGSLSADASSRSAQAGAAPQGPGSLEQNQDGVITEINVTDVSDATLAALTARGAKIISVHTPSRTVTAAVQPFSLNSIAALSQVLAVHDVMTPISSRDYTSNDLAPVPPQVTCNTIISEADTMLSAATGRATHGVDGTGFPVGVISDSFATKAAPVTTAAQDAIADELPGVGNTCGHTTAVTVVRDASSAKTDEGRAMLQAVHDLAPGAPLLFSNAVSEPDMATQVTALRNAGAKIISDDLLFFSEPWFQDGPIANAMNANHAAGTNHFAAAGNETILGVANASVNGYETSAYRSMACPAGLGLPVYATDCHNFNPNGSDATYGFTISATTSATVLLQWAQPRDGATTDLDFYLINSSNTVETFDNTNNLGAGNRPSAGMSIPLAGGAYRIVVSRYSAGGGDTSSPRFRLYFFIRGGGLSVLEYNPPTAPDTSGPTIVGHACADKVTALAATAYNSGTTVETYSSRGPCTKYFGPTNSPAPAAALAQPLVVSKPDVTATDGAVNSFFGSNQGNGTYRFFGTSQASPHAAAVAALLRQKSPGASTDTIRNTIINNVTAMPAQTALDRGTGRVNALAALNLLGPPVCASPQLVSNPNAGSLAVNTSQLFTATVSGCPAPEYLWWVYNGSTWAQQGNWSPTNTFNWTPNAVGSYLVGYWARQQGTTPVAGYDTALTLARTVTAGAACTSPQLASNPNTSSIPVNTSQLFTATVSSCPNPEYLWFIFNGVSWAQQGNWGATNTFNWTPNVAGNAYQVAYWARQQGSMPANGYDVVTSVARTVTAPVPCTNPQLASSPNMTTIPVNTIMTFTATVSSCPNPQYLWWVFIGASWVQQGNWTSTNTFNWNPIAVGNYQVGYWARQQGTNGTNGSFDVSTVVARTVTGMACTAPLLASNPNLASISTNTNQLFTATVSTCPNPEYLWWVFNGTTWIQQGNWSATNTFNWTPTVVGNAYIVGFWARQQGTNGSNGSFDVSSAVNRTVTAATPCTNAQLASSPNTSTTLTNVPMFFTATVSTCPNPQYLWWVFNGVSWTQQGNWTSTNTFNWIPSAPGSYLVGYWARQQGTTPVNGSFDVAITLPRTVN